MKRMRRGFGIMALVAAVPLVWVGPASAQTAIWFAGGATFPSGDYGDEANTGWMVDAGLDYTVGESGVFLVGEGLYGSNDREGENAKTNLFGALGHAGYAFSPPEEAGVFVFGGMGALANQYKPEEGDSKTDWQGAADAGAGYSFPLGGVSGFVIGRYVLGFDKTTFVGIHAGLTIPVGGGEM